MSDESLTFYLDELAITQQLSTEATMNGEEKTIDADATIIEGSISLSDAKNMFKCIFTNGTLTTNPTGNFSPNPDFLSDFNTVDDSDVLSFLDGLVTEMTGASGASDVLDNESVVKDNVVLKLQSGITAIESGVIDNDTTKGDAACVSLFNQIKQADSTRFQLISSVPTTTGDNNLSSVRHTNCLVAATGSGSGAKVTAFDYATLKLTIEGRDGSGAAYAADDVLLFIHSSTGTGFFVTINTTQAGNLNGNSANTDTLTMTEIAEANITAGTFSNFKKLNSDEITDVTPTSGDTTDVTPTGSLELTVEHGGTEITDTTITTANNTGQSDFSDGDVIVAYSTGATPQAIVLTLNSVTAAFLNNNLANAGGVSMPLVSTDKLDFKVTIEAAGTQKDASGGPITYTHNFGLRGKLDLA